MIKVIIIMVMSLDGKTTQWGNPNIHRWTSTEDQAYFSSLIEKSNAVIIGRKTYEVVKKNLQHRVGRKRIVMTSKGEMFQSEAIPGQLVFSSQSPFDVLQELENEGCREVLLLGGERTNTKFLQQKLVHEVWVTVEPKILGKGNGLWLQEKLDINLILFHFEKLNKEGTMLLKYRVMP